jgi:hypothetical protein
MSVSHLGGRRVWVSTAAFFTSPQLGPEIGGSDG